MNKTKIVNPGKLEIDATIPQCLDNQYISDEVFKHMINYKLDYTNDKIRQLREKDFKIEFIRSLIYSSQVIINRAFFLNSDFLYKNYLPSNQEDLLAFSNLMNYKVIIPYLFKNKSLDENLQFDISKKGDSATQELFKHLETVTCVRLSENEQTNQNLTTKLEQKFRNYLMSLKHLEEFQYNDMISKLFNGSFSPDMWNIFKNSLVELSNFAFDEQNLTRDNIYKKFFIMNNNKPSEGKFKIPEKNNPFLFEIKKLVDLKYNTNLPDFLKRYTFTPRNMPDRTTLQDWDYSDTSNPIENEEIDKNIDDLFHLKHNFIANSQSAMNLPLLSDLTISDVLVIRGFEEWSDFINIQQELLKNPLSIPNLLSTYQDRFNKFQKALSVWYNIEYKRKHTEKMYSNFVSVAIVVAGETIILGITQEGLLQTFSSIVIPLLTKNKYLGISIKLMLNVIDIGKRKIDKQLSSSLEIMKSNQEYSKEEILSLIKRIEKMGGDSVSKIGKVADMGAK